MVKVKYAVSNGGKSFRVVSEKDTVEPFEIETDIPPPKSDFDGEDAGYAIDNGVVRLATPAEKDARKTIVFDVNKVLKIVSQAALGQVLTVDDQNTLSAFIAKHG